MKRSSTHVQVYVHHYVSSSAFLLGNGAELRGSFSRQPVKAPYGLIIDTSKLKNDTIRQAFSRHSIALVFRGMLNASISNSSWSVRVFPWAQVHQYPAHQHNRSGRGGQARVSGVLVQGQQGPRQFLLLQELPCKERASCVISSFIFSDL
jgi:hypothetical protein